MAAIVKAGFYLEQSQNNLIYPKVSQQRSKLYSLPRQKPLKDATFTDR